jgi:hypothetical protein
MPTLEELFKSKQLPSQGGKTAEEAYAVQNSKDIRISSADPFVNTVGMSLARLARKGLGVRGSESLLEEEVTGARIIRTASAPFIYGTELPRLLLRTTDSLSTMKTATSGELADTDNLGGKLTKLKNNVSSALGLPITAIPTYVVNELNTNQYKLSNVSDRMTQLGKIQDNAAGSLLGQFLKQNANGNLKTVGKQALGAGLKLGKQALRKKLFGDGERKGLEVKGTVFVDNSVVGFTEESSQWFNTFNVGYGSDRNAEPNTNPTTINVDMNNAPYSKTVNPKGDTPKDRNDLSLKQQLEFSPIVFTSEPERVAKFSSKADYNKEYSKDDFIENKRGMYQTYDTINSETIFDGDTKTLGDGTTLDDKDFVPLKFTSVHRNKTVQFRATITGLSETLSPSWDSGKFIGSPFSYYTYSGIERSVSFNFKVYSLNANEHKIAWDKINFLNSLVYPQGYYDSSAVVPPFIKFTLGDMYSKKFAFIESLSHTFDDNTPWNITDKETPIGLAAAGIITGADIEIDMKGYRLPMITDVAVTIKFLESRSNSAGRKFYSFEPQTN